MGINEIRALKLAALEPKGKAQYSIPKISEKKKKQEAENRRTLEADKLFYLEIWVASPHVCGECDRKLGREPLTLFFHHLLEKRNYPEFRYTPENIAILCADCHTQAETDIDKTPKTKARREQVLKLFIHQ